MNPAAAPSHRNNKRLAIFVAIGLGAGGFLAGRFSVPTAASPVEKKSVEISVPAPANSKIPAINPVEKEIQSALPAATASNWDEKPWTDLMSQPGSPARNAALAALLEKLAATDPDRAMALAQAEGNLKLREQLVQSSLHGWARTSPTNAANWALNLTDPNGRERALSTVFAGAVAADPEEAIRVGKMVIAQNPNEASGTGSRLIDALCDGGNFDKAAQMASSGDAQTRSGWMGEAYSKWAEFQPQAAADAANAITDADARNEALHGIVGGWSEADPAALVQFVAQLSADTDRDSLLGQSLGRWAKQDPKAAAEWINQQQAGTSLDQGIKAVATTESLKPDIAVAWAESVVDPKLRSETLVTVLRNWLPNDLNAAENYFTSTKNLLPEDRQEISDVIAALKGQTAAQ